MTVRILTGDARTVLPTLPDESVHCCVTSPPYFGLRDYGTAKWEGGDEGCDHRAANERRQIPHGDGRQYDSYAETRVALAGVGALYRAVCGKCGAARIDSQIGLERTPDAYVAELVSVFREVRRVLRKDGTLWLNLGDSYNNFRIGQCGQSVHGHEVRGQPTQKRRGSEGLKEKDLLMIPARVALALQADGWWLRSDIIWSKPNPMPESVTDRPTSAHEHVFLLAKSERYWFDAEAVRETCSGGSHGGSPGNRGSKQEGLGQNVGGNLGDWDDALGRNIRNVWTIATQPYPDAHFATFPPALVEPCIKAGTSERGCCYECGAPWERVVEREPMVIDRSARGDEMGGPRGRTQASGTMVEPAKSRTLRWEPSCRCRIPGLIDATAWTPKPCTVLDPFGGAGTVGLVADRLGRNAVLIELNPAYAEMARKRIHEDAGMFASVA